MSAFNVSISITWMEIIQFNSEHHHRNGDDKNKFFPFICERPQYTHIQSIFRMVNLKSEPKQFFLPIFMEVERNGFIILTPSSFIHSISVAFHNVFHFGLVASWENDGEKQFAYSITEFRLTAFMASRKYSPTGKKLSQIIVAKQTKKLNFFNFSFWIIDSKSLHPRGNFFVVTAHTHVVVWSKLIFISANTKNTEILSIHDNICSRDRIHKRRRRLKWKENKEIFKTVCVLFCMHK